MISPARQSALRSYFDSLRCNAVRHLLHRRLVIFIEFNPEESESCIGEVRIELKVVAKVDECHDLGLGLQ